MWERKSANTSASKIAWIFHQFEKLFRREVIWIQCFDLAKHYHVWKISLCLSCAWAVFSFYLLLGKRKKKIFVLILQLMLMGASRRFLRWKNNYCACACASIANENQDYYLLCELKMFSIMLQEVFDKQESSIFWKHTSMFFRATKLY